MQPPGFESNEFPNHVFKLDKARYSLKQAPRAWYEHLSNFLLENDFKRGKVEYKEVPNLLASLFHYY